MRRFHCGCGHGVFFENYSCGACHAELGFDQRRLAMCSFPPADPPDGFRHCANRIAYGNCNWLVAADDDSELCFACRMNAVIPNLTVGRNLLLWSRLEQAKRRLLYDLLRLRLPLAAVSGSVALRFEFLEDQRSNPQVLEPFVTIGHVAGVITINVAEADHPQRHAVREQMGERYRTLLGHFRHESGHFFFPRLISGDALVQFRQLFGDESADYKSALDRYYARPQPVAINEDYITTYASAHPHEDWAESWAHYLHIQDGLETATAWGLVTTTSGDWVDDWVALAIPLNEMNRSLGGEDVYPFVLSAPVAARLRFIHRQVASLVAQRAAWAGDRTRS
ncbi:MAG: putative zinc-binding metallopeptidase [Steroidobacteraceae bacterium]